MLVRTHDAMSDAERRDFLATHDFGQLVVPAEPWPILAPTHFAAEGDLVWAHYAVGNPVLDAIRASRRAVLTVIGDYAYVPGRVNAGEEGPPEHGVPTSYYAAVHLRGEARVVDDPAENARILNRLLDRFEPRGGVLRMTEGDPRVPLLRAIRGVELRVTDVQAKMKYGGNRPAEHRRAVARALLARGGPLDAEAAAHALRRLGEGP